MLRRWRQCELARPKPIQRTLVGRWHYRNPFPGLCHQEKVALLFLECAVGWFADGGQGLVLHNMTGVQGFFCPRTKRPYPAVYALREYVRLFEGTPKRRVVNVLPVRDNLPALRRVSWVATDNATGCVTVLIAGSFHDAIPSRVRVVCPLPWNGDTLLLVRENFFPKSLEMVSPPSRLLPGETDPAPGADADGDVSATVYDRYVRLRKQKLEVPDDGAQGGVVELTFSFDGFLLLRFVQLGTKVTLAKRKVDQGPVDVLLSPLEAHVTDDRAPRAGTLAPLRGVDDVLLRMSGNYQVKTVKATPGLIGKAKHLIPMDEESFVMEVGYPSGSSPQTAEGVALNLDYFDTATAGKPDAISFWVMARPDKDVKLVKLGLMLGRQITVIALATNKWQRVEVGGLQTDADTRYLQFFASTSLPEYAQGKSTTFEFNGFRLLDRDNECEVVSCAVSEDKLVAVLRGVPGESFSFRQHFDESVAVAEVSVPGADVKAGWQYEPWSQTLRVNIPKLPVRSPPGVQAYLQGASSGLSRRSGTVLVALVAELQR